MIRTGKATVTFQGVGALVIYERVWNPNTLRGRLLWRLGFKSVGDELVRGKCPLCREGVLVASDREDTRARGCTECGATFDVIVVRDGARVHVTYRVVPSKEAGTC